MADQKLITSIKKVPLEGVSEGWDESCFAYVTPGTFKERLRSIELEKQDDQSANVTFQDDLLDAHFVSGTIKGFDGTGFVDMDLTVEDAKSLPDVSNKLTLYILGYDIDPKDLRSLLASQSNSTTSSPTDIPHTETASSEGSTQEPANQTSTK